MQKIKRDDEVIVIAGKDKGKRGTIKRVLENRYVVSGVNMIKRHTRRPAKRIASASRFRKTVPRYVSTSRRSRRSTPNASRIAKWRT